ncbi:MAG TPA: acylphosphatase [Solirubrobacterales bacterium]|nr:acylphosphatase [Solirubrobacterales bacterium]
MAAVTRVGFRRWIWRRAQLRGLSGWVRNKDTSVEAVLSGPGRAVESLVGRCRTGPAKALVAEVDVAAGGEAPAEGDFVML